MLKQRCRTCPPCHNPQKSETGRGGGYAAGFCLRWSGQFAGNGGAGRTADFLSVLVADVGDEFLGDDRPVVAEVPLLVGHIVAAAAVVIAAVVVAVVVAPAT